MYVSILRCSMISDKDDKWLNENRLTNLAEESSVYLGKIFTDCLNARDEKILIMGDKGTKNQNVSAVLSYAYYLAAEKLNLNADFLLQTIKKRGETADEEVISKLRDLENNNIILAIMSDKLGSLKQIGKSFRRFCQRRNHRFVSTLSLGYTETGMVKKIINSIDVDYKKFATEHQKLKYTIDKGKELHVSTVAGTDVYLDINGIKALCSDGNYVNPGTGGNLPAGEVFFAPRDISGKIVIDASSRNRVNTRLIKNPITLTVEKGDLIDIKDGDNAKLLEKSLKWAEEHAKYPERIRKIAEFGIGLNPKAEIIGATIIDEKVLGTAHVGIGSNYWFGGPIRTIIHLDQVFRKPLFKLDGESLNIKCEL